MSVQRIFNVMSEDDFKTHLNKKRKEIIFLSKMIHNPKDLNERKMFYFYRVMGHSAEKKMVKKFLHDFQFLSMHIIKKYSTNRYQDMKKYYGFNDDEFQMIKFLFEPNKYPPGGYVEGLKKYDVEFYNPKAILKKLKFKDYIDLYALITYIPFDSKNALTTSIIEEILKINPLKTSKDYLKKVLDLYDTLSTYEKQVIEIQIKNISYYHYKLLKSNNIKPVIIDGSNAVRYEEKNTMDTLLSIMDNLYIENMVFFPIYIVFDNNIKYFLSEEEQKVLEEIKNCERVFFNSPADDMIIKISNKYSYYMISNDKFKEYKFNKNNLIELRRFLNV